MASRQILHSITDLNVGGAEIMLQRLVAYPDGGGFSSSVLSLMAPGSVGERIAASGVTVHSLNMTGSRPRCADALRLARKVRHISPDLLHGWMYHGNIAASVGSWASFGFTPVIWSIHHSLSDISKEKPLTQRLIRLSARLSSAAHAICYCSTVSAEQHERIGFDARRRTIIPNGVDCNIFRPRVEAKKALSSALGIPSNRYVIGNVGRFHIMKDQDRLVRAISLLVDRGYDVQGAFVGVGRDNSQLAQTAMDCGIHSRITTLDIQDDVSEIVAGLDVIALSSAWGEAFPLAIAEAMACGVPAVVTNVGDCGWLVGDTGRVVPPVDTESLAGGLASVLDLNLEARRAVGIRARQRVLDNFSLDMYVSRTKALYEASLAR
jgi:glycosyltransferase involved in cell wall biosynthesis